MANRLCTRKGFKQLFVEVFWGPKGPDEVDISHNELGWKYSILIFAKPKTVAKELRKIADYLENL